MIGVFTLIYQKVSDWELVRERENKWVCERVSEGVRERDNKWVCERVGEGLREGDK